MLPPVKIFGQLTSAEVSFVENLAGLSYAQGDILYHNGTNLVRLAAGASGRVLQTNGAGANPSWETSGAGDVTKVGTPVDSQIGVWTGNGTIEGDVDLTFDTSSNTLALAASAGTSIFAVGGANILVDSPRGTMTLSNIDALDATTEATIEAAIDTLTLSSLTMTTAVTSILDEDNMASNSATALATQQSIKAYVDSQSGIGGSTGSVDNALLRADGTGGATVQAGAATATLSDNNDLTLYDATNDGNPVFAFGASATERLTITPTYDTGAQTIDYVEFATAVASATADKGEFRFNVDGTLVATFDDGGLEIKASGSLSFGAVDILTDSTGTTTLNNIDALDATTEATIEAAIDTLANLTAASSLATVGTVTSGVWNSTFGATANEAIEDLVGAMVSGNTETNITVTYQDADGTIDFEVPAADLTTAGAVELATVAETNTGTDATRAVTPDGLDGWTGSAQVVTVGALDSGSITSNFGAIDNGASNITTTGDISGGTLNATGDTAAGDNAAIGYTATEGIVITGQGSTNDITVKNDADASVFHVLTGTTTLSMDGDIDMNGNDITDVHEIRLDGSPDTDHTANGFTTNTFASGYTSSIGDLVYMGSASKWLEADASAVGTAGSVMLGIALEAKTDTQAMLVALPGSFVRDDTWAWTVGAELYASETLGAITETAPTTADAVVRVIGHAVTADVIWFQPEPGWITHTG